MSQGPIDHPSYLTRQQMAFYVPAGASHTSQLFAPAASNIRLRACNAMVQTAGTAAATIALFAIGTGTTFTATSSTTFSGTSTIGTATLSTSAAGTIVSLSTDANLTLNSGGRFVAIGGTDATVATTVNVEVYVDPLSSWTGN